MRQRNVLWEAVKNRKKQKSKGKREREKIKRNWGGGGGGRGGRGGPGPFIEEKKQKKNFHSIGSDATSCPFIGCCFFHFFFVFFSFFVFHLFFWGFFFSFGTDLFHSPFDNTHTHTHTHRFRVGFSGFLMGST